MQAGGPGEHVGGPVARIIVQERPAARKLVLEVRELAPARTAVDVILAADGQADAATRRDNDRGRPDLDIELDHLALPERLRLVVAMVGPVGVESFLSSLRCDARSQPWPIGVCGSMAPWNTTSLRSPVNTRSTANRSASFVDDETNSLSADGPVISVSFSSGSVRNVTPSPMASNVFTAFAAARLLVSAPLAGSR